MQFKDQHFYNCEVMLNDGTKYRVEANWLHNEHLDNWQGWECAAGSTRISIESDMSVYSGECLNNLLGNLLTEWDLLPELTKCHRPRCTGCTDDLLQFKRKLNDN